MALGVSAQPVGISERQVLTGDEVNEAASVSPDGRYLVFRDPSQVGDRIDGNLILRDLVNGGDRRLTNHVSRTVVDGQGEKFWEVTSSSFSADGKQLAYSWCSIGGRVYTGGQRGLVLGTPCELHTIGLAAGSNASRLVYSSSDHPRLVVRDWTPDGKGIAVVLGSSGQVSQIGLVDSGNGTLRILRDGPSDGLMMKVSPDGAYAAFGVNKDPQQTDIYVMRLDGSGELPIVERSGINDVVGWTPDGKKLLFWREGTDASSVWEAPFASGKLQGEPQLLKENVGRRPFALGQPSRSGSLYYLVEAGAADIYTASIDFSN
jgi:Tol biopolymer transport system component